MARIVAVHGTYAHAETKSADGAAAGERQWWQAGSAFEQDMRELVQAENGPLEVERFEWSGENSEIDRREAGRRLHGRLAQLEAAKEQYCLVGHSHGGSVISAALLESAARRQQLDGLKRWITVGTPFVGLKRERLLFARLDLVRKVILIASMMLLMMFLLYIATELASGKGRLIGGTFPSVLVVTGVMMSLPAVVCYLVLKYLDGRNHLHHRPAVRARAAESFAGRWLPLTHSDDEAVQGLGFLPEARLDFFDKAFAVPTITMVSVLALPLLYLLVLASPPAMLAIGDWLKTRVYDSRMSPETEKALKDLREQLRVARTSAAAPGTPVTGDKRLPPTADQQAAWKSYRAMRQGLEARHPDLRSAERAMRFRQRFFEQDGRPCPGARLCGGGEDLRINSGLLLHVATDELSWAIGAEETSTVWQRWLASLLVPALLVPLIAGLVALALMLVIRGIAHVISRWTSRVLNHLTKAEVTRAAFGNDTEGEIALRAVDRPAWLERSPPRLPGGLADIVTAYSNAVASQSLAKFRRAIGQLVSADSNRTADGAITTYFTWKELVHASYFDVPELRKTLARAVSRSPGFAPTPRFAADPDFARTAQWLAEIEGAAGTSSRTPPPGSNDAGAVSAVIASTVKAEP